MSRDTSDRLPRFLKKAFKWRNSWVEHTWQNILCLSNIISTAPTRAFIETLIYTENKIQFVYTSRCIDLSAQGPAGFVQQTSNIHSESASARKRKTLALTSTYDQSRCKNTFHTLTFTTALTVNNNSTLSFTTSPCSPGDDQCFHG